MSEMDTNISSENEQKTYLQSLMSKFFNFSKNEKKENETEENKKDKCTIQNIKTFPKILNQNCETYYDTLVLSGGGKKGILQLGVLHCLQTNHIIDFTKINNFIGTSIGAMICFMLCIGFQPVEILTHAFSNVFSSNMNFNLLSFLSNYGICSNEMVFDYIHKITEEKLGYVPTLLELYEMYDKHLVCVSHNVSADIYNGESMAVYIDYQSFPNLSCIEAIRMSSNIPIIFEKYVYDKNFFIDGALSDNYPIKYAQTHFKHSTILGISIREEHEPIKDNPNKTNVFEYMKSLLDISYKKNYSESVNYDPNCENVHSVNICVSDNDTSLLNISSRKKFELFSVGYKCGVEIIEKFHNRKELKQVEDMNETQTNEIKSKLKLD